MAPHFSQLEAFKDLFYRELQESIHDNLLGLYPGGHISQSITCNLVTMKRN